MTFFAACMALDEKRVAARRMDILCCISCVASDNEPIDQTQCKQESPSPDSSGSNIVDGEKCLAKVFRRHYSTLLVESKVFQAVVVVVGLTLVAVAGFGVTQVSSELDLSETFSRDSFVLEYTEKEERYFSDTLLQVSNIK